MSKFIIALGLCFILVLTSVGCRNSSAGSLDAEKQTAVAVVHSAATGLGAVLKDYPAETDRINFIRSYIDPIRFYPDQSGYFYVYNLDCVNIAHATQKDLQGQNLHNYQDSRGNYVIRLLSAAAKNGGGFVEYYWVNPSAANKGEQKKIGYVEPIPGTDYFIGTGVYLSSTPTP
jgi:signal transduction histidine kinase